MKEDISTHSMLTTFKRCPRQAMYKYHDMIRPKTISRPLKTGSWFHQLLEVHLRGGDWKAEHQRIIDGYFEEEIDQISDAVHRLMRGYLWHYQLEPKYGFKTIAVEETLETDWPDGSLYRCKVDWIVEWQGEIWFVDHKLRTTLPNHLTRLRDSQSLLYMWCGRKNKIPVKGFIWNYGRMRPPVIPQILKDGSLSKRKILTDYPTLRRTLQDNDIPTTEYLSELTALKATYWRPDKIQESPFWRRESIRPTDETIKRLALEMYHTRKRMAEYNFNQRDTVERVLDDSCNYRCGYPDICAAELYGGNVDMLTRIKYERVDPLDYYGVTK